MIAIDGLIFFIFRLFYFCYLFFPCIYADNLICYILNVLNFKFINKNEKRDAKHKKKNWRLYET